MITKKTYNALRILKSSSSVSPMSARQFAHLLWGDNKKYEYLFTGVSYTGNGACTGKKAWLCAGSLLGTLAKKDLVIWTPTRENLNRAGYFITNKGRQELSQYESSFTTKPQS